MNSGPMPLTTEPTLPESAGEAERLSAWLDGELEPQAADAMVAGLLGRADLQRRYSGWCMVGDALRSREVLDGHSPDLCARIGAALHDEPALLAPSALRTVGHRFLDKRHLASGFAVAAAAAVLVLVAVPQLRSAGGGVEAPAIARSGAPAGATEPVATIALAGRAARNPRLDPYIQAHRDFMGNGVMPAAAVYLRSGNEGDR